MSSVWRRDKFISLECRAWIQPRASSESQYSSTVGRGQRVLIVLELVSVFALFLLLGFVMGFSLVLGLGLSIEVELVERGRADGET